MNHLGLFEGIGGFSLAARWVGWDTKGWVEINPYCQHVLKHHFPEASGFGDVKKFSYAVFKSILRHKRIRDRRINIITGGFPCQPYSSAGKRKGKADDRHLWPQMLRIISEVKPKWVVGENVLGIVSWNRGMVFNEVQADLEAKGYEVQTYVLPACAVDAPHQRYRVWFVAHARGDGSPGPKNRQGMGTKNDRYSSGAKKASEFEGRSKTRTSSFTNSYFSQRPSRGKCQGQCRASFAFDGSHFVAYSMLTQRKRKIRGVEPVIVDGPQQSDVADSIGNIRCKGRLYKIRRIQTGRHTCIHDSRDERTNWRDFPTQPPICGGNDGISPRLARITIRSQRGRRTLNEKQSFNRHRIEAIRAYGNAVVPPLVYEIFKAIQSYENNEIQTKK